MQNAVYISSFLEVMAYCINPDCSHRENPDNFAVCQNCGTPLILQNRYRIRHPLQVDISCYTEVFEIEDLLKPNQPKILKSLKELTPVLLRLFEQEASILTNLKHPGLPVGETLFPLILHTNRQLRCLVMEKVPGQNLQAWLSQHQYITSYKIALNWLKELTQILKFVHEEEFFHRDIKPANIMLRPDGKLVLIDFGTARKMTQTIVNGNPVTVAYSHGYTAPEQIKGRAVVQSDFYALGWTFIYLLTGINPASNPHHNLESNWSKYVKDQKTPKKLLALIQQMTDTQPQRRPPNAQAILEKIEHIEKYPQMQWQKLLLTATCGILLFPAAKWLYEEITLPIAVSSLVKSIRVSMDAHPKRSVPIESVPHSTENRYRICDNILDDHLSCGEESLIPSAFRGNNQPPLSKQLAIKQYRSKNFAGAARLFKIAFDKEPDSETLIYLNNAKIQIQFTADKIYTIAVAIPLERHTTTGLEILRGAAQAQTEALKNGQPLRIIIADDNNRDESIDGNDARRVAQKLVRYPDLLAVLGHYSSEATKQALPIYSKAQVVLISATSTSNNLKNAFFFRTVPSGRIAAQKMANYVFSELKQRQAAIFYSEGSEYAQSLSTAFREAAKSLGGNVIQHQSIFNLATDSFDAKMALNQAKKQGATAVVLIPDPGVGLYNAIPNALLVIQSNVNQAWIVAGNSLDISHVLKLDKVPSPQEIQRTAWAIPWHYRNDSNSAFVKEAQILWKIEIFPNNTDITWRTATSYDAVLVLSKALTQKPTRSGIKETLSEAKFSVTGATGIIQFAKGDRQNGKITMVRVQPNCDSSGFVFIPSDRPLKCQF